MTRKGYDTPFFCSCLIKVIPDIISELVAAQTEHNNSFNVDEYLSVTK